MLGCPSETVRSIEDQLIPTEHKIKMADFVLKKLFEFNSKQETLCVL